MDAGTFGLSLGLEYNPGIQAEMPKLVAIAERVPNRDGVITSHMRSEDAGDIRKLGCRAPPTGAPIWGAHARRPQDRAA